MKYFGGNWFRVVFLAMAIVPAVAQFEIAPDHFGDSPSKNEDAADSIPSAALKQQIAEQSSLLADYRRQIQAQAALVEEARQLLISPEGSADEGGESIALTITEKKLQALQRLLEGPIRVAEANLASLETIQAALMASANDRSSTARHAGWQPTGMTALSRPGSLYPVMHAALPSRTSDIRTRETETSKTPSR